MSAITEKFAEYIRNQHYWKLGKDFRQFEFQENYSKEEQFMYMLEHMDYSQFEKYFEEFINKYCEIDDFMIDNF